MVVPVVLAGARVAASTRARQGVVEKSSSSVSNAKVVRRTREKDLMFMQEASNDARYDSIDVKKNKDYAQNVQGLRGQIVEDLAERREQKKQEENNRLSLQRGGRSAQIYNFVDEKNNRTTLVQEQIRKKKENKKRIEANKKRAAIARTIRTFGITMGAVWLFIQLPFAILYVLSTIDITAVISGGIEMAGDSAGKAAQELTAEWGLPAWLGDTIASTYKTAGEVGGAVVNAAAKYTGLSALSGAISEILFAVSLTVLLSLSLITTFVLFITLTMSGVKTLSGDRAGLKIGAMMAMIVFSILPGTSLFPASLLWVAVLWKYPN